MTTAIALTLNAIVIYFFAAIFTAAFERSQDERVKNIWGRGAISAFLSATVMILAAPWTLLI